MSCPTRSQQISFPRRTPPFFLLGGGKDGTGTGFHGSPTLQVNAETGKQKQTSPVRVIVFFGGEPETDVLTKASYGKFGSFILDLPQLLFLLMFFVFFLQQTPICVWKPPIQTLPKKETACLRYLPLHCLSCEG